MDIILLLLLLQVVVVVVASTGRGLITAMQGKCMFHADHIIKIGVTMSKIMGHDIILARARERTIKPECKSGHIEPVKLNSGGSEVRQK
jgi:hypothetical protein